MVIDELHIMGVFFLVGTKKPADPGGRAGATGGAWGAQLGMARYFEGVGDVESNAIDCLDSARLRLGNMLQQFKCRRPRYH